jgi:hypothetical protein
MKTFEVHLGPEAGIQNMMVGKLGGESFFFMVLSNEDIEIRDEYHSMHELYEHRMALNIALFNFMYMVDSSVRGNYLAVGGNHLIMKSKLHYDGTMFDGYFIVMALLPEGQVSYHYKLKHWDKFKIPEVEKTPKWDGHTSKDVLERLMKV